MAKDEAMRLEDYDLLQLPLEVEWRTCFPNTDVPIDLLVGFEHFCENYWTIQHPAHGRMKFKLFDSQREAVLGWMSCRYSINLKARQVGWSTLVAAYAFWAAQYGDRPILLLSRTLREAEKLLRKVSYGYSGLPAWMREGPGRIGPVKMTQTKHSFTNGSYIESLPSASDPARGESAWLIAVDEFAFLNDPDAAWAAIEPVADVGGRVILLSTAKGEGTLFHTLWVGAETGTNRFDAKFFPWHVNGRDQDWYDRTAKDTPDWQMAQEYPSNAEEAFLKSGRPVFDLDVLRSMEAECREPVARGFIDPHLVFNPDGGPLRIYELPSEDSVYVLGADVSQGLEHGDYSSVHVIDARTGHVVAHWHGHTDPDLLGSDVIYRLGLFYESALVGVESNMHGLTTLKALDRLGYFPLYTERNSRYKSKGRHAKPTQQLGIRTTQISKPLMVDYARECMREGSVTLWDSETVAELKTYVRNDKEQMEGSPFDDRTMSFCIANWMRKFAFHSQYSPERNPPAWSVGGWQSRMYGDGLTITALERGDFDKGTKVKKAAPPRKPIGLYKVRGNSPLT